MAFNQLADRLLKENIRSERPISNEGYVMLNQLMSVIVSRLQPLTTIDEVRNVVNRDFVGQIKQYSLTEIDKTADASAAKQLVYEYLLTEILDLASQKFSDIAGIASRSDRTQPIDAYGIISVVRGDDEMFPLFQSAIPQFPYSHKIPVDTIVKQITLNRQVLPGFILSIRDYIRALEGSVNNLNLAQLADTARRFGYMDPTYTSLIEGQRDVLEAVVKVITRQAMLKNPGQLGFLDVLAVTAQLK